MSKRQPKTTQYNPFCLLRGSGEWAGNGILCHGPCEGCGHDQREHERRIKLIRQYGLEELYPGQYGLRLHRKREKSQ